MLEDHQSSPNSYFILTMAFFVIHCAGSHKTLVCFMLLILILKNMIMCVWGGEKYTVQDTCEGQRTTPWSKVSLPTFI